ncbi:MAG: helix-turn-helix domain-containing protein [Ruminococcaceae bacterium]|nr:helix-turn-helix domain-containing protein [Oscillospiraceae bacterium]
MSRKRIAVITARADDAEQKDILCGIAEAAFAADADVVVYSNIYNHWAEDEQLNYENIIYTLFEPHHFDGAVITAEAFRDISVIDEAVEKLRAAKLATVVIGGALEGFESVSSDDENDMERLAEHLIKVHGYTDIDILTGAKDNAAACRRANGCIRAFEKHGIAFDEQKLHYGNFWNDSGEELARCYISGGYPMPQAVICTNDLMAYGLCDAFAAAGISVPDRVAVTGYDCTGGRIYHYPLLTSYRRNRRGMGVDAVNILLGTKYEIRDDDRLVYGGSCGCGANKEQLTAELCTERIGQYHTIMGSVAQFSSRLTMCRTLAEYTAVLAEFRYLLHGTDRLYLCLDKAWSNSRFVGEEYLCCEIGEENVTHLVHRELPPAFDNECPNIFYFSPICFQTRLFGYTVMSYPYPTGYDFSFRDWSKTVADTLEFLRMKNDIHYLKQCQRETSLYDSLTGFYNLREFRQITEAAEEGCSVHAVKLSFVDDGEFLYGENYRNDIIASVAAAIKRACIGHEICGRADGDIFLVLCKGEGRVFSERVRVMLHDAMCGSYDERQVVLTRCLGERSVELACDNAIRQNKDDMQAFAGRKQLQRYSALQDIRSEMMKAPEKALTMPQAAKRLCCSEGHFRSVYKQCFGVSYNQDCIDARVLKACYLLLTTAMSVYGVAVSCGYDDEKYFARQFKQNTGASPLRYRRGHC